MKVNKKRRKISLFLICGLLFCVAVVDYWAYPYGATINGRSFNHGENGLWLRYLWYFGQHSEAEVVHLAHQLHDRQIRYAYFHVRHVGKDGKLVYRYLDKARLLTRTLRRECPDVKLLAWVDTSETPGKSDVVLTDRKTRQAMIEEALWLIRSGGFDGVQWDVEPCPNGDKGFLALLQETRVALPPDKLLAVATPIWMPKNLQKWGWGDAYFAQVAATCDQMAVMDYDSGMYFPRSYVWLMRQQALHVTRAAAHSNSHCRVMLGVPTYGEALLSHNPQAENLSLALRGVREGLNDPQAETAAFAGIALFADYTTTSQDWQTYNALWLIR